MEESLCTEMTAHRMKGCSVLDQTSEQMATLQRENHHKAFTTLRLKPPLEDTHHRNPQKGVQTKR